jgi:hypothetical protein
VSRNGQDSGAAGLLPLDEASAAAWLPLHYLDLGREDTCNPSTSMTRSTKILAIRSAGRDRIVSWPFGSI